MVQTIAALQVVNAGSPLNELPIDKTASASTFNFARDVVDFRVSLNLGVTDTTPLLPFSVLSLSDAVASETVTLTYAGANGTLSGGGVIGSAGSYSLTGSPAQLQAALRAVVFTPTLNEVTPGQTVGTTFSLAIAAGATTRTDTSFSVSALSVNDAPSITGTSALTTAVGVGVRPFAAAVVTDPDVGQTQTVTVFVRRGRGRDLGRRLHGRGRRLQRGGELARRGAGGPARRNLHPRRRGRARARR